MDKLWISIEWEMGCGIGYGRGVSVGEYLNKSRVSRVDRWVDGNVWGDNRGDENR